MKKRSDKKNIIEVLHFFALFLGLSIASILFYEVEGILYKFYVTVITAALYVVWGAWHHSYSERFTTLVLLEYSLVSFLAILLSALGLGVVRFF